MSKQDENTSRQLAAMRGSVPLVDLHKNEMMRELRQLKRTLEDLSSLHTQTNESLEGLADAMNSVVQGLLPVIEQLTLVNSNLSVIIENQVPPEEPIVEL